MAYLGASRRCRLQRPGREGECERFHRPPGARIGGRRHFFHRKYRFRFCRTPHLPHGWDAGVLFEETQKTLLCSDLFHQTGDVEAVTESDVVGRSHQAMREYQTGILAEYVPYTPLTSQNFRKLAELKPQTLAIMHGSSFRGDGARALQDLDAAFREVFGREGTSK